MHNNDKNPLRFGLDFSEPGLLGPAVLTADLGLPFSGEWGVDKCVKAGEDVGVTRRCFGVGVDGTDGGF